MIYLTVSAVNKVGVEQGSFIDFIDSASKLFYFYIINNFFLKMFFLIYNQITI